MLASHNFLEDDIVGPDGILVRKSGQANRGDN
jgi:hypothetical protein